MFNWAKKKVSSREITNEFFTMELLKAVRTVYHVLEFKCTHFDTYSPFDALRMDKPSHVYKEEQFIQTLYLI